MAIFKKTSGKRKIYVGARTIVALVAILFLGGIQEFKLMIEDVGDRIHQVVEAYQKQSTEENL